MATTLLRPTAHSRPRAPTVGLVSGPVLQLAPQGATRLGGGTVQTTMVQPDGEGAALAARHRLLIRPEARQPTRAQGSEARRGDDVRNYCLVHS